MNNKDIKRIAQTFKGYGFEDEIPESFIWYGIQNATIVNIVHPDNLWTILDRMDTMIIDNKMDEKLTTDQQKFLRYFLRKWKDEIEPYCVKMESE